MTLASKRRFSTKSKRKIKRGFRVALAMMQMEGNLFLPIVQRQVVLEGVTGFLEDLFQPLSNHRR